MSHEAENFRNRPFRIVFGRMPVLQRKCTDFFSVREKNGRVIEERGSECVRRERSREAEEVSERERESGEMLEIGKI